jgi:RNA-binding protein 8A
MATEAKTDNMDTTDETSTDQGLSDQGRRKKGRGHRQQSGTILAGQGESLVGGTHRSRGPAPSVEGWILFASGVHEDAVEDDIQEAFEDFGDIKDIQLPIDRRTGYVKGYALIQFGTQDEARNAMTEMDGAEVLGEKIRVSWAVITPDTGGRGRSRGGGGGGRGGGRRSKSRDRR